MRTKKHRSIRSFFPDRSYANSFSEIIGPFRLRSGASGWLQEYRSSDGGEFSVSASVCFDDNQAGRLRTLLDSLDECFPLVFEMIEKGEIPISKFSIEDLELSHIFVREETIGLAFASETCDEQCLAPAVWWDGVNFTSVSWRF